MRRRCTVCGRFCVRGHVDCQIRWYNEHGNKPKIPAVVAA